MRMISWYTARVTTLSVYLDFKSPYAFIAKDPSFALEQDFGVEIDWQPLTLNIASYLGTARTDDRGKVVESNRSERQWAGVKYAYYDARRYASLRGLTLRGTQKIWDSSLAAIGFLWVRDQDPVAFRRYVDITFERFWRRELDIEDVAVIRGLLAEAGAEVADFEDWARTEGRALHDDLQERILNEGLFGVPTYVIDSEVYFGRQYLPRVRWHLGGRDGVPPDIAYDSNWSDG